MSCKNLNPLWIFHQSQHSCDSARPDTFLAQLLSFNSQSLRAWRPFSLSPALYGASVSHFTGHQKDVWVPSWEEFAECALKSKEGLSWVQKEILQICCSFYKKKKGSCENKDNTARFRAVFLKQESIQTLHFLLWLVRPVYQTTTAAVFGEWVCFFFVFWCTGL